MRRLLPLLYLSPAIAILAALYSKDAQLFFAPPFWGLMVVVLGTPLYYAFGRRIDAESKKKHSRTLGGRHATSSTAPPRPGIPLYGMKNPSRAADRQQRADQAANTRNPVQFIDLVLNERAARAFTFYGLVMAFLIPAAGIPMIIVGLIWAVTAGSRIRRQARRCMRAYKRKYRSSVDDGDIRAALFSLTSKEFRGYDEFAMSFEATGTDRWHSRMWEKYGRQLVGREEEMRGLARLTGGLYGQILTHGADDDVINGALLPRVDASLWQVRNVVVVPDTKMGDYPVQIADLNALTQQTTLLIPNPRLIPSTFAQTYFPSDHRMVVYPDKGTSELLWRPIGDRVTPIEPELDKLYNVRAPEDFWPRLVLTVNVIEQLIDLYPVVLLVDNGRITLQRPVGWVEPAELVPFAEAVAVIARAAKAAEA